MGERDDGWERVLRGGGPPRWDESASWEVETKGEEGGRRWERRRGRPR
jgi:hypothetical protein